MLSDTIFEVLRLLEQAIKQYDYSQQFKEELKLVMTYLFSIQYRLDIGPDAAEDVWPLVLEERTKQWELMFGLKQNM